jgi:PKD repeat protein
MTFDPVTGNVILFGGFSYIPDPLPPAPLNDTWLFSAGAWTNITSGLAPRARGAAGMVYDSNDSCVLLFGGTEQLGSAGNQNDTWGWCAAPPLVGLVITVSPAVPLPNVAATFAASVRGGVMPFSYFWQFSDGGTSALATPQHTYAAVGDYSVRLWLNDSASHSAHVSRSVRVYVPLAFPSLLANPNPALLGQPVNFTSSESGGTPPYTYAWTFGDGGTGGNLPNITHVYTTNGPFKVELSVTDYLGAVVHAFLNITIELQALVQSTTSSGSAPLVVTFTGGAQGGAPPYTYAWNFGDGTPISTVQNPSHIFAQSGTYPVVLTITDAKGNHASNTILVQVTGGSSLGIAGIELLIGGLGFSAGAAVAVVILAWRRRRSLSSSPEAPKTKVP